MKFLNSLSKRDLSEETAILRVDFNITDADLKRSRLPFRIAATLPTLKFLKSRQAKIVILSHRGRPISAKIQNSKSEIRNFSLRPFAEILSRELKQKVNFADFRNPTLGNLIGKSAAGSIFLLENLRFFPGEEKNDVKFAKKIAGLGTFYVNDAFGVSHRKNASVAAITRFLPSYAGFLLERELKNLSSVLQKPKKPIVVIVGGAKIADKLGLVRNFIKKADVFLIGGGIANTFLAAQGLPVGNSLCEEEMIPIARRLLRTKKIILPDDFVIRDKKILDIGPKSVKGFATIMKRARTIIWNGPMGYVDDPRFEAGSIGITKAIFQSRAFSVVGGGETANVFSKVAGPRLKSNVFLSTGGGAMLEFLAGKKLPGIEALK